LGGISVETNYRSFGDLKNDEQGTST